MPKFLESPEAVDLIADGQTVGSSGFRFAASPEELFQSLGRRYEQTSHPRDLSLVFASAQGDSARMSGLDHLAQPGMLRRVIGGFFGVTPKLNAMVISNAVAAYNLPQGQLTRLYHSIGTRQPGLLTRVGLHTYIDPRLGGGKMNEVAAEELIEVMQVSGAEYLFYRSFPIHVALIRATTSDEYGNLSMEREAVRLEALPLACAARASGGIVIAQVEGVVDRHTLHPRMVEVPGYMVDVVVVSREPEITHRQTVQKIYTPEYCGEMRAPGASVVPLPSGPRRIVARRSVMELRKGAVVNLGSGMPEGIGSILSERGESDMVYLTLESGVSGGIPETQPDFGVAINPDSIIRHDDQFCFYNSGGIDTAFLGFAQVDGRGNVNVSRFSGQIVGCGGFIDIAQNAKEVVFCGTFNSGGLEVEIGKSGLRILREGRHLKFVPEVEQITFNGKYALSNGQNVLYVTERCVFRLMTEGMMLEEIAPGVDLQKDIVGQMRFVPLISPDLRLMDVSCFS